jgi:hypothetical protein
MVGQEGCGQGTQEGGVASFTLQFYIICIGDFETMNLRGKWIIVGTVSVALLIGTVLIGTVLLRYQLDGVVIRVVTNDWGCMGNCRMHLRSFVFVVRKGWWFGPQISGGITEYAQPFELRRVISPDSVEIGYDLNLSLAPPTNYSYSRDTTHTVVVSCDYVTIVTNTLDGGTECFVWVDTAYEFSMWDFEGPGRTGRETTDSERPDTSFLLRQSSIYPDSSGRAEWTERLDSAHSFFLTHGVFRAFYPDGTPREETGYALGRRQGSHRRWYDNGQLQAEGFFHGDAEPDTIHLWHRDGSAAGQAEYVGGTGSLALRYENDQLWFTCRWENDYLLGVWREWYHNGQMSRLEDLGDVDFRRRPHRPIELDWFKLPARVSSVLGKRPKPVTGIRSWYADGRIKAYCVCDTTVLDTPLDLEAILKPWDTLAVTELSDPGSVTGGKLHFPIMESRSSRCRVERELFPNGQLESEAFYHVDSSFRKLTWDSGGHFTDIKDRRPTLHQEAHIGWENGVIRVWEIDHDQSQGDFTRQFVRYRNALRDHGGSYDRRTDYGVDVRYWGHSRPIWRKVTRGDKVVSEETLDPNKPTPPLK